MFNNMFLHHGENCYKLGKSHNVEMRLTNFITPYVEPCTIKLKSNLVNKFKNVNIFS